MRSGGRLRRTIKEAIDDLPNGICVFDSTGLMVLCNHTMYQLGFLLAGRDIQTLSEMRKTLKELPRNSTARRDGNLFILSDGRAWQFSECKVEDSYGESFIQFIAADVTELYIKRLELEEGNRILEEYGYRLRRLSANIQAATREEEILDTKMRVHDNIGRGIIAARQYLLSGRPMAEFDMSVWEDALQILKYDVENTPDKTALEQLMDSAKAIGIRVHIMGMLPENTKIGALMIIALRECANNAVRHAGADELYAKVETEGTFYTLSVTNNGQIPQGEIKEGGGLGSLRTRIEKAGGKMSIRWVPEFELSIRLWQPEEDILW